MGARIMPSRHAFSRSAAKDRLKPRMPAKKKAIHTKPGNIRRLSSRPGSKAKLKRKTMRMLKTHMEASVSWSRHSTRRSLTKISQIIRKLLMKEDQPSIRLGTEDRRLHGSG